MHLVTATGGIMTSDEGTYISTKKKETKNNILLFVKLIVNIDFYMRENIFFLKSVACSPQKLCLP